MTLLKFNYLICFLYRKNATPAKMILGIHTARNGLRSALVENSGNLQEHDINRADNYAQSEMKTTATTYLAAGNTRTYNCQNKTGKWLCRPSFFFYKIGAQVFPAV